MPGFVPKRMHAYKVPEKLKDDVEEQIQSMLTHLSLRLQKRNVVCWKQ